MRSNEVKLEVKSEVKSSERPTFKAGIAQRVRFRQTGRPDLVGEGEILAELEDGEVDVDRHRVVARVLVDRLDAHPPRSVVLLGEVS